MALIKCPECGRTLSDKAKRCPGCGVDMKTIKQIMKESSSNTNSDAVTNKSKETKVDEIVGQRFVESDKKVMQDSATNSEDEVKAGFQKKPRKEKIKKERKPLSTKSKVAIVVGILVFIALLALVLIVINWKKFKTDGTFESIYENIGICFLHDYTDADCENPKTCCICGKEVGNSLGHNYYIKTIVDPTCVDKGSTTYQCSRCNGTYINEIEALGHSYEGEPEVVDPTCTEDGKKINKCIRCDNLVEEVIPAMGHNLTEATCTSPSTCVNCKDEVGSALGHTTMNGICERCGEHIVEPIEFSGYGDTVLTDLHIPLGQYRVYMTNSGASNFIIYAYSGDSNGILWMNEIGAFNGYIYTNKDLTDGMIEIRSSGDWTIKFEQIEENGTSNIQGKGYAVTPYFTLKEGNLVIDIVNQNSNSNFITYLIDENGKKHLITNEIGNYTGQVVYKVSAEKKYCLWVSSDGEWTFNFGIDNKITYVSNKE